MSIIAGNIYVKVIDYQDMFHFHVIQSVTQNVVVRDVILIQKNGTLNIIQTQSESIERMEDLIIRAELKLIETFHVSWYESFIKKIFYCDKVNVSTK